MSLPFEICYEDNDILVINKPAGFVVNLSKTVRGKTIQDLVAHYLSVPGLGIGGRSGIVHRLDKDTSGILLIAKNDMAFVSLQSQFKDRIIQKEYITLVHGFVLPPNGKIIAPIARNPFNRERFGVFPGGRDAQTVYEVICFYEYGDNRFSLLRIWPLSGRTHQIRVHLKYLGYPVVGDLLYAGRKKVKEDMTFCPRLFLHALKITFIHPKTKKKITLEASLPNELTRILERFSVAKTKLT
jgi:23S rRNA pseudouridine1911/1915/1917 synthase